MRLRFKSPSIIYISSCTRRYPLSVASHATRRLIPRIFAPSDTHLRRASTKKMADFQKILTKNAAPPAGPYTQAIGFGNLIFCSGQIPADKEGNLIEGSIGQKTEACIKNIIAILEEAGSTIGHVAKVNVFLDDMAHFAEMNATYEKYFSHKPARSCVAVKTLPKNVPVEIECIAVKP